MAVFAYIVPDKAMSHDTSLGRDSWSHFPVLTYRDVSETETIVTFESQEEGDSLNEIRFKEWVDGAVGMVERVGDGKVVVKSAGKRRWLPNEMSWVTTVNLTNN